MRLYGDAPPLARKVDDECPAVGRSGVTRHEPALDEPVQNAGERRPLVRQYLVELAYRRRAGMREVGEDVRFALGKPVFTKQGQVKTDPVGCAMNPGDELQLHGHREA